MQSKLIIKNFGPISEVILDLRNVNVFIGPQASGKSAIAKIYTIFKAPGKFLKKQGSEDVQLNYLADFKAVLEEYNIHSFLRSDTEIIFESELHNLAFRDNILTYEPKLLKVIEQLEYWGASFETSREEAVKVCTDLLDKFIQFGHRSSSLFKDKLMIPLTEPFKDLTEDQLAELIAILKDLDRDSTANNALYIPAERNIVNIIKKNLANLQLNKVPIPTNILSFTAELEKIQEQEIDLNFIQEGLSYKIIAGEDRILHNRGYNIKLTEAASGIQSVVPILKPISARRMQLDHFSFVIEEPELNLFPTAQYELIQYLESIRRESYWEDYGTIHTYTTHSPYILSAINNLLFAYKVRHEITEKRYKELTDRRTLDDFNRIDDEVEKVISHIIKADINPKFFSAYQICEGKAEPILDRENGLINDNYIDESSDKINDDFDALMNLLKND